MGTVGRGEARTTTRSWRYGLAAAAVCAGLVVAPVHGVAWADQTGGTSATGTSDASSPGTSGTSGSAGKPGTSPSSRANAKDSAARPKGAAPSRSGATSASASSGVKERPTRERTTAPDTSQPTPSRPDSAGPDSAAPDSAGPDSAGPDSAGPDSAGPDSAGPDSAGPDSSQPHAAPPDVAQPEVTQPEADQPAVTPPAATPLPSATPEPTPVMVPGTPKVVRSNDVPSPARTDVVRSLASAARAAASDRTASDDAVGAPAEAGAVTTLSPATSQTASAPSVAVQLEVAAARALTPTPPQPLSPIAALIELPGRIVNAVLQFLDFTTAAGTTSPFHIAPINDLIFGAFREIERLAGLQQAPAVQPALPTMTYTGPTDAPSPTVAQFLDASTAAYGWGTTPGGMVPFTVNGFQLQSTNVWSGMSAKTWVTPQGQVIIAYQGTTGGTNLLVNPLIALTQLAADLQVVLTNTTPLAFYDALGFAQQVQREAALQGYAADDVFVTGHSLGGWEAQFVAQQTGLAGIGFESPGLNTTVPGNGADANFVNVALWGSPVAFMSTDLPGLQPFFPAYVPGGGIKPHYGPIVTIGDRAAMNPLVNSAALWGQSPIGGLIFALDFFGNFFQYHLMGVQAYHLDVDPDPGVVPWLGTSQGTVHTGYGALTIQQLLAAASGDGILVRP